MAVTHLPLSEAEQEALWQKYCREQAAKREIAGRRRPDPHKLFPAKLDQKDGWPLCRVCGKRTPSRRNRSYCSKTCIDLFLDATDLNRINARIYLRSDGKCGLCGLDIKLLEKIEASCDSFCWEWDQGLRRVDRARFGYYWWRKIPLWGDRRIGFTDRRGHLYEIDHILPVSLGGGPEDSNLRLLCLPCHKAETKKLAGILAKSRRREKKLKAHQQAMLDDD